MDYNFIKNHYRLIAVDLSWQKQLHTDPKPILQIELVGQLKNIDGINADGTQNMFILTILEKNKEMRLKFSRGSVIVLWKMANYQKASVKLTNTQLSKSKSAAKNKTGIILRLKKFEDEELPNELFLTTRQTTKIINGLANIKSADIKLSITQISKIIQLERSLGSWLVNLGKKELTNITIL